MKISIFTDGFLPYLCGVTFSIVNQANALVQLGHEITIFRPKPSAKTLSIPESELDPRIAVVDVPYSLRHKAIPDLYIGLPFVLSSLNRLRRIKPDLIHLHSEWGCGWEGLLSAKILKIPTVGTFHTFYAEPTYLKHFHIPNQRIFQEGMWRYSLAFYNRCDAVIAPSVTVRNQLKEHGLRREPTVISNGIPAPPLQSPLHIHRRREKIGLNGGPSFIYFGRVSYEKSLDICLRAFHDVHKRLPKSKFLIVGDGPSKPHLDRLIGSLGLHRAVIQLGSVGHEQLINDNIPLLGDIFVTASTTENQPVSILEAMSFGLPVIGPRAKGIPELVENDRNGLLTRPGDISQLADAMVDLTLNGEKRRKMADVSKARAGQHSIGRSAEKLGTLYSQILSTP